MLHLDIQGAGEPVVFLHGLPTAPDVLAPIAARVATFAQSIVVHLPGYGRSAELASPWTLEQKIEALESTLTARGVTSGTLVGFSGGAYLAFALALRGFRATSIVALGGLVSMAAEHRANFHAFAKQLRDGGTLRPLAAQLLLAPESAAKHPEWVREVEDWMDATPPLNLARELETFAQGPDLAGSLGRITCPVLARVGALDAAAPVAKSEEIVRGVPFGHLEIVANVGHALSLEDREGTADAVVRFVARA